MRKSFDVRPQLMQLWVARTARERLVLGALGALMLVLAAYAAFWQPARAGAARLEREMPQLREELGRMQSMAGEILAARGRGSAAPLSGPQLEAVLQQSLKELGLPGQKLDRRPDGRFVFEWHEAPFSTMADFLDQARQKWHVAVTEGHVERGLRPGNVNARLVLRGAE